MLKSQLFRQTLSLQRCHILYTVVLQRTNKNFGNLLLKMLAFWRKRVPLTFLSNVAPSARPPALVRRLLRQACCFEVRWGGSKEEAK